ncbi:hypothetical protein TWF718_004707 [Orbilia javanica]|uniref:Uncharacterized protein n=1 Tax=Orbilia javanica TaxID=47235 RepID=A0AAN8RLB4_9PEZI
MSNNPNLNNINPPIRGNPIPQAPINRDPSHGRLGPMVQLPIPKNRDGKPDYNRAPGLDLSRIVPVGSLNTNPPPTEGLEGTPTFSGGNQKKYKSIATRDRENNKKLQNLNLNQSQSEGQEGQEEEGDEEDEEEGEGEGEVEGGKKGKKVNLDVSTMNTQPASPSEAEALAATDLLAERIPSELITDILDRAEYFAHEVIGSRSESASVSEGSRLYLTAQVPDFTALEKGATAGKGGKEGSGGRRGRVRKLAFRFKSRDQGWSSAGRFNGTFKACWSWLDVEVWRKREEGEQRGADDDEKGMYKVTESLLQRNRHAESDMGEYEIVWRWDEDKLKEDDEMKWEDPTINSDGEATEGAWERGGRHERNGEFVRELKGGDEIRVFIKALFSGWRCDIKNCEVECWWAV